MLIVGGGYDNCEDTNDAAPSCGSTKGNAIYILDAAEGSVLYSYPTERAVPGDVSLVDIDSDGYPDYAYAADTGGNLYRIDFIDNPSSKAAMGKADWKGQKVAYTNGGGRKFLFGPSLLSSQKQIYMALGSGDRERPLQTQYPTPRRQPLLRVPRRPVRPLPDTVAYNMDSMDD